MPRNSRGLAFCGDLNRKRDPKLKFADRHLADQQQLHRSLIRSQGLSVTSSMLNGATSEGRYCFRAKGRLFR